MGIPIMIPMLSRRSGRAVALGYALGIGVVATFCLVFWVIRPLVFPATGQWNGDAYIVGEKICGNISEWQSNDIGAHADPSFFVGMGGYKDFTSEESARRQVEKWCR